MRVLCLGDRLVLAVVFVNFGVSRSLDLYQFPPPPPMKPGWGSLPEVDSSQVAGLKVGDIDSQPAALYCAYHSKTLGSCSWAHGEGTPCWCSHCHA